MTNLYLACLKETIENPNSAKTKNIVMANMSILALFALAVIAGANFLHSIRVF